MSLRSPVESRCPARVSSPGGRAPFDSSPDPIGCISSTIGGGGLLRRSRSVITIPIKTPIKINLNIGRSSLAVELPWCETLLKIPFGWRAKGPELWDEDIGGSVS